MLTDPKDIRKTFNKNGDLIIEDDYVNKEFVMKLTGSSISKAYYIIRESKNIDRSRGIRYFEIGKTTLSSVYAFLGLKGRFE